MGAHEVTSGSGRSHACCSCDGEQHQESHLGNYCMTCGPLMVWDCAAMNAVARRMELRPLQTTNSCPGTHCFLETAWSTPSDEMLITSGCPVAETVNHFAAAILCRFCSQILADTAGQTEGTEAACNMHKTRSNPTRPITYHKVRFAAHLDVEHPGSACDLVSWHEHAVAMHAPLLGGSLLNWLEVWLLG